MWRVYLAAVRCLGRLAGALGGPLLALGWRDWGERLCSAATAAGVALILVTPAMIPAQGRPSQSEFERLRTQVEGQTERLNRAEIGLDMVRRELSDLRVNLAEALPGIKQDINGLKWITGLVMGALLGCLPVAFKAGRWYQKTEHISGERTPIKAQ